MRRIILSLAVVLAATSAGYAQQNSTLRGVYGPPELAAGSLRGVYAPPQSAAPTSLPTTITGPSSATSDSVPSFTVSGAAAVGQELPQGVTAAPMSDRPGYGRVIVNGHSAIVDTNDNRIVQLSD